MDGHAAKLASLTLNTLSPKALLLAKPFTRLIEDGGIRWCVGNAEWFPMDPGLAAMRLGIDARHLSLAGLESPEGVAWLFDALIASDARGFISRRRPVDAIDARRRGGGPSCASRRQSRLHARHRPHGAHACLVRRRPPGRACAQRVRGGGSLHAFARDARERLRRSARCRRPNPASVRAARSPPRSARPFETWLGAKDSSALPSLPGALRNAKFFDRLARAGFFDLAKMGRFQIMDVANGDASLPRLCEAMESLGFWTPLGSEGEDAELVYDYASFFGVRMLAVISPQPRHDARRGLDGPTRELPSRRGRANPIRRWTRCAPSSTVSTIRRRTSTSGDSRPPACSRSTLKSCARLTSRKASTFFP